MTTTAYGESFNGQTINLAVGQTVEIRLPENPTTGFRWQLMAHDGTVCAMISDAFKEPVGSPGRAGEHSWVFEAIQPGGCDIELHYRRRWVRSVEPDRTFRIHVRVEWTGHGVAPGP